MSPLSGPDGAPAGGLDPGLAQLADAYGVATSYQDWAGRETPVAPSAVRRALAAMDVDADNPNALALARERPWRRLVEPTVVVAASAPGTVALRVAAGTTPDVLLRLEDGTTASLTTVGPPVAGGTVDGVAREQVPLTLPPELPLGYHRLEVSAGDEQGSALVVAAPGTIPLPGGMSRVWGWMVQLYAVRSPSSWGMGDYADLAELGRWSGRTQGAGVLLVNPLHAVAPTHPVQASPYYPSSRRFSSPLYLRPQLLPEYASAPPDVRAEVDRLAAGVASDGLVDRDAVWDAKLAALELLFGAGPAPRPEADDSQGVADFALWCALAEERGPDWHTWPVALQDPASADVATARERLAERVALHRWLQHACDEQLAAAQREATLAGMPVGIVHDLAVGVDPGGADAWALQRDLAQGVTVGAPPDSFNQHGQDWRLPPWRPDRLPESGYQPFRDMVRAVLAKGGGLRVDHVMGLSRLWWVPEGDSAADGTYVRYDLEAMLGVLALEAVRAGALVVGEDLGTVEPALSGALSRFGVLGSSVLWFEREDDAAAEPAFTRPEVWRRLAAASVTTHDLPTAAGFLAGEHVRVRADLGLLGRPVEEEAAAARADRAALLDLLLAEGLVTAHATDAEVVLAMHAVLARSPSAVVLAALGDAVGDLRQPNLPGTTDAYPNWRLPVADGKGRPLGLPELQEHPGVARLASVLADAQADVLADGQADEDASPASVAFAL